MVNTELSTRLFTKVVVYAVIALIMALIVYLLIVLAVSIASLFTGPDPFSVDKEDILTGLGMVLLVVICVELMETIYGLITRSKIHVETVLMIGITAVTRELIIFNYDDVDGLVMVGMGVVIASIAAAYFLIRKSEKIQGSDPDQISVIDVIDKTFNPKSKQPPAKE